MCLQYNIVLIKCLHSFFFFFPLQNCSQFSALAKLLAKESLGRDLRLLSAAVSLCVLCNGVSYPQVPHNFSPRPTQTPSHVPMASSAVFQPPHLLSSRSSHYLCCLQDSQGRNALRIPICVWVQSSSDAGNHLHAVFSP